VDLSNASAPDAVVKVERRGEGCGVASACGVPVPVRSLDCCRERRLAGRVVSEPRSGMLVLTHALLSVLVRSMRSDGVLTDASDCPVADEGARALLLRLLLLMSLPPSSSPPSAAARVRSVVDNGAAESDSKRRNLAPRTGTERAATATRDRSLDALRPGLLLVSNAPAAHPPTGPSPLRGKLSDKCRWSGGAPGSARLL